jgi:hypothetical protein
MRTAVKAITSFIGLLAVLGVYAQTRGVRPSEMVPQPFAVTPSAAATSRPVIGRSLCNPAV